MNASTGDLDGRCTADKFSRRARGARHALPRLRRRSRLRSSARHRPPAPARRRAAGRWPRACRTSPRGSRRNPRPRRPAPASGLESWRAGFLRSVVLIVASVRAGWWAHRRGHDPERLAQALAVRANSVRATTRRAGRCRARALAEISMPARTDGAGARCASATPRPGRERQAAALPRRATCSRAGRYRSSRAKSRPAARG
jgi:hypothetical protein